MSQLSPSIDGELAKLVLQNLPRACFAISLAAATKTNISRNSCFTQVLRYPMGKLDEFFVAHGVVESASRVTSTELSSPFSVTSIFGASLWFEAAWAASVAATRFIKKE